MKEADQQACIVSSYLIQHLRKRHRSGGEGERDE